MLGYLFVDESLAWGKLWVLKNRWCPRANILTYYSTNCNTIQIWSWCCRYLSSVGNRYPAIYVASYVGRKSEVKKCPQKDLKMLRAVLLSICWIIKQLSFSILRNIVWYSARFRRIIVLSNAKRRLLCLVIFQKRVRVFHRGFQTRENNKSISFFVYGNSDETLALVFEILLFRSTISFEHWGISLGCSTVHYTPIPQKMGPWANIITSEKWPVQDNKNAIIVADYFTFFLPH